MTSEGMRSEAMEDAAPRARTKCPICGKPASEAAKPFCSSRCADVDLGRWFGERYVVPGPETEDSDGRSGDAEAGSTTRIASARARAGHALTPSLYRRSYRERTAIPVAAQVAQLVEHTTENRSVGGSIPPLGTNSY